MLHPPGYLYITDFLCVVRTIHCFQCLHYLFIILSGVLVLSWYPPGQADEQGKPSDKLVRKIMDIAHDHQIRVNYYDQTFAARE